MIRQLCHVCITIAMENLGHEAAAPGKAYGHSVQLASLWPRCQTANSNMHDQVATARECTSMLILYLDRQRLSRASV
jgi:hypothetical protein